MIFVPLWSKKINQKGQRAQRIHKVRRENDQSMTGSSIVMDVQCLTYHPFDHCSVKVVDVHPGIDDDLLGNNTAGSRTQ